MSYESNIQTTVIDLKKRLKGFMADNALVKTVATTLAASNVRRIHNEGKAVNGSNIGNYDTKSIYVNPDKSPKKFTPQGKGGDKVFKSGKAHKTKYFDKGYKGFRAQIGRRTNKVDLNLTAKLEFSFQPEARGNDWVVGFTSKEQAKIARGNEKRFGKIIWGVSSDDDKVIQEILGNAKIKRNSNSD